ncbi:hypothetical protein VNO77_42214 [Canavalia gladiata]|uniref:THH1/TOM1/TOM3 domain-containing protein n=1 Tax=Canavalia gladiata TaxID=3824 RepID=A0AAN9K087_CANGL
MSIILTHYKPKKSLLEKLFCMFDVYAVISAPWHSFSSPHFADSMQIMHTEFKFTIQKVSSKLPVNGDGMHSLTPSRFRRIARMFRFEPEAMDVQKLELPLISFSCFLWNDDLDLLSNYSVIRFNMVKDGMLAMVAKVVTVEPTDASSQWNYIYECPVWQDRIFYTLGLLYGFVASMALVQLVQIQLRVPEYCWTKQKVFYFLNFSVNGVRCLVFIFFWNVQGLKPEIVQHILLDLPSLAFFTMYALFILFWPEMYYQAVSTDELERRFYTINIVVYAVQIILWLIFWWKPIGVLLILSKMFFAGVSLFAALGLLCYSRRLFLMVVVVTTMLQNSLVESQRVGSVTTTFLLCFLVKSIVMCFNVFADLDILDHPILNFIYYLLLEILPSFFILFVLRKLLPKYGIMRHPVR